ncbi:MAG: phosphatase PAP2 family protein [Caldimonas sp.]
MHSSSLRAPCQTRSTPGALGYFAEQVVLVPLLLALVAWSVQHSAVDEWISRAFFDPPTRSFGLRDAPWLAAIGHHAARGIPVFVGGIAFAAAAGGWFVRALRPWRGIALCTALAIALGPLAVALLKAHTSAHCPYVLDTFGGVVDYRAEHAGPFWATASRLAGHCLPSGHASGGYAMVALYFAGWAAGQPRWRYAGLAIGIALGLVFSAVRIAQGSHFASQTIWSAAVDWLAAALVFAPLLLRLRPSAD